MADEPVVAAPVETPVAAAPVATPEAAAPASPDVAQPAPAAEPAAPVTDKPAEAPKEAELKAHTDQPSLLAEATAKPGEEKKDATKPDEPKPADPKPEDAPATTDAPVFKFEPYTLPEGIKAEDAKINSFNELLTKADMDPQQRGQALLDMHAGEMRNYDRAVRQQQHDSFLETRNGWRKEVMGDPELGGSGHRTAMTEIAEVRDQFVSRHKAGSKAYERDRGAFESFLATTGAGDNPAFLRFLHNVSRWSNEPAPLTTEIKPPPDLGQKPKARARLRDAYNRAET